MAVVEDRVVRTVGLLDLVQRLGDQEGLQPIASHEGQRAFEEIETAERREFVEHQQQAMPTGLRLQVLGEPAADLVEDQAHQRLCAADVRRRHHQEEAHRPIGLHQVSDPPVATPGDLGDHGIAVDAQERHGGREHAGPLVLALVEELAGGRGDHRVRPIAKVRRRHHGPQRRLDRAARIGEEGGDACEGLVGLGVEDVQDRADEQAVAGLLPVRSPLQRALRVDQDVGDVLHVANLRVPAPNLQQRVVSRTLRVGGIEAQHPADTGAAGRGQLPVLALDVVDDQRARPGEERGHYQAHPLPAPRGRETEDMLWPVVAQVGPAISPQHHALVAEQPGLANFVGFGPSRRAIGSDVPALPRAPDGQSHGRDRGDRGAADRDGRALEEDAGRIGVEGEPPPEEGERRVDRPVPHDEPGPPELRLEGQAPSRPFRRGPDPGKDQQEDERELRPHHFRAVHGSRLLIGSPRAGG